MWSNNTNIVTHLYMYKTIQKFTVMHQTAYLKKIIMLSNVVIM